MRKRAEEGRRRLPLASFAALVMAAAFLLGPALLSCDPAEHEKRREKIEEMYENYKRQSFPEVIDVEPRLAMDLAKRSEVLFVDVRPLEERSVSMIPGAVTEEQFLSNIEQYRNYIIIGYCTISYRSGKLAQELMNKQGITMYNLRGGLLAWVHDGGKIVTSKGETKRIHVYGRKWNLAPSTYEAVW
ncbi:MAG: rhodanese-like domain-containing protein [Thermodesulfobacteriota bacterium]